MSERAKLRWERQIATLKIFGFATIVCLVSRGRMFTRGVAAPGIGLVDWNAVREMRRLFRAQAVREAPWGHLDVGV